MKNEKNYHHSSICFGFTIHSCETLDTGQIEPQNLVSGNLDDLVDQIQIDFPQFIEKIQNFGSKLTRIEHFYGDPYDVSHEFWDQRNNDAWSIAYGELLPKMEEAALLAESQGDQNHLGVVKVLKAFTLMTLVDFYGDVPYSDIGSLNPTLDDGQLIYNEVFLLLDEAIQAFNTGVVNLENDYYYNNDFSKWIKLANTLKMSALLSTRLVDSESVNKFTAIANTGNFISTSDDDFEFNYGNAKMNHPDYLLNYKETGAYTYRPNWLMDEMVDTDDPRLRYYFYRQIPCTPGNVDMNGIGCQPNEEALFCSVESSPSHYPADMVFCSVARGYWGRDHGYSGGIPPDTFSRTAPGVYPVAGNFDQDEYISTSIDAGGLGFGIMPMMLASWVDFMQAEVAISVGDQGAALDFTVQGMQKSIDKAMGFISVDPDVDPTYEPTSMDVSNFITAISNEFNTGDINTKWNVLAEQQLISQYGNGVNSYNMYRRTGFSNFLTISSISKSRTVC